MKKNWRVRLAVLAVLALLCAVAVFWARTAKENARLKEISGKAAGVPADLTAAVAQAVAFAESMEWKPYDPLMGRYGDPFGKLGFVVCIDVPVRAYQAAGIDMPAMLRQAAREHREWFSIGPDNPPSSSFFYRRVRNYHPLFRNHPRLVADPAPRVGDWAFYGKTHIALVVEVEPDGRFVVIEASPHKGRVAYSDSEYMADTWGPPAFFGRLKPGK